MPKISLKKRYFCRMMDFKSSLQQFFQCEVSVLAGGLLHCTVSGCNISVVGVPMVYFEDGGSAGTLHELRKAAAPTEVLFLYEDRWLSKPQLVKKMLYAHTGRQTTVFARNCEAREIEAEKAAEFLDKNHLYGSLKAGFRYGLFRKRATGKTETDMGQTPALVAVSVFSKARDIDGHKSYEWLRYASLPECRVVGGMGKLLETFARERLRAEECIDVMSYADLEWSGGGSYEKLGFERVAEMPPVAFLCNTATGMRIHGAKIGVDNRYKNISPDENFKRIFNPGSIKFVRLYEKL